MTIRPSLVVFFAAATLCLAQSERGNITGVVTDASNAAVPGVPVKIVNVGTNAATNVVSTTSGEYSVANLGPGTYRLEVSKQGFQSEIVDNITLTAGATARVDVQLKIGGVSQTVEVQAQNAQIQTEDAKISTSVSEQARGRTSPRRRRRHAQPLRPGHHRSRSQERQRTLVARRRTGGAWAATLRRPLRQHQPLRATPAKPPTSRPPSKPSPNSPSTPTASRPSTARPAAA